MPIPAGKAGRDYIAQALEGGSWFSRQILARVTDGNGKVFALAPSGLPAQRLEQFHVGGLTTTDAGRAALVALILSVVGAGQMGYFVSETMFRCSDPHRDYERALRFCQDGKIYEYALSTDGPNGILEVLRGSYAVPFVHFGSAPSKAIMLPTDRGEVSGQAMRQLVSNIIFVAIGAYDEESHVLMLFDRA